MKLLKSCVFIALFTLIAPGVISADDDDAKKRHPSYNLMGRDTPATSPLNPNFVVADEAKLSESGFWRSAFIPESLVGLTVADIDRDGQNEVIYASSRNVYVTRFSGGTLHQLAKYTLSPTDTIVSLDTLDLTGDGRMEIIISAQDDSKSAASQVLSFTGSDIVPLATKIPWYLRVVGSPDGRFLAGQKPGTSRNEFFTGNVMRMNFDGKKIVSQGRVGVPQFVNLFNFTLARLGSSGTQMVAAIKFPSEHVFLFEGGHQVWESREEYGGTMNYLDSINPTDDRSVREFLPSRILIADIDGDGQNELIVAKNDRGGIPFMSKQRGFTSGAMQAFKYANLSLTPFFRSRTMPGPGVDYALADFNNNGTLDLVVAVVTEQKSGLMKDGRSVIVAYEIGVPKEPK